MDLERFKGTCYKAANWLYLGKTTGRGKNDQTKKPNRSIKAVWGYPLCRDFRAGSVRPEDEKRGPYQPGGDCRPDRASRSPILEGRRRADHHRGDQKDPSDRAVGQRGQDPVQAQAPATDGDPTTEDLTRTNPMSKDKPHRIEITAQEMEALIERGEQRSFFEQDYPIVVAVLRNYFALDQVMEEKSHTILRLVKMVFGHRTEKAKEVLKNSSPEEPSPNPTTTTRRRTTPRKSPKGMAEMAPPLIWVLRKCVSLIPATKREMGAPSVPKGSFTAFMSRGSRCALSVERP